MQYQTQYAWITRLISLLVFTGLLAHSLAGIRPIRAQGVADLAAPPVLTFTAPEDMSDAVGIASAGLPSPVFDMNQVAWMSIRGLTSAEHQQFFDDTDKAAYLAIDVEAYPLKGEDRYGSVWQENPDGRGWLLRRNLTFDEFDKLNKEQYLAGYRLIDQNIYFQDGAVLYSAIWIENVEGLNWVNFVNLTEADHIVMSNRMVETGMIPIDIEVYTGGPNPRYSTVWVENVENLDFLLLVDMSEDFFVAKWEEVKATLRVVDLESYMLNGKQYYAAIWYQNTNGRGWASLANLTGQDFSNAWHEWRDAGYRLIDFEAYPTANGLRYAGVWRQNGERISWRLKNQVTDLAQAYFDNNPVAGMSVAIAVDGQFRYLKGFGFADVAAGKTAHSQTVFRLASVSKALAGVLTMRMVENGDFALDHNTRDYFPALPFFHTHTIQETVSMRAGVRHYGDPATDPTHVNNFPPAFATAQEAATLFQNDPLLYIPGAGAAYSTHSFTLLGGAMEGATGTPVADIFYNEVTVPFNVPSLQAEDRSITNFHRAALYAPSGGDLVEIEADDNSWKVLGGGLESSTYDLARLGMRLLDESVLSADSVDAMWTTPNGFSNFALGWDTGSDQGNRVVARTGAQPGSRAYVRIYPDLDIVIVILLNVWVNNTDHAQLGRDIGTLLLDNLEIAQMAQTPQDALHLAAMDQSILAPKPSQAKTLMALAVDPRHETGDIETGLEPVERPPLVTPVFDLPEPGEDMEDNVPEAPEPPKTPDVFKDPKPSDDIPEPPAEPETPETPETPEVPNALKNPEATDAPQFLFLPALTH